MANNGGQSSSILDLSLHRDVWPSVSYTGSLEVEGVTLATLFTQENVVPQAFDALVVDTQGSELDVLKGAEPILAGFRFVLVEAADFEAYVGGCTDRQLTEYLRDRGYAECVRRRTAFKRGVGSYWDILFRRKR